MTATMELAELEASMTEDMACECRRANHHPGHVHCSQSPDYAVKVQHAEGCKGSVVVMLCQDCLDEALEWATTHVGKRCYLCYRLVKAVGDLIGPVIELR